jgi:pilus assembly protein Flp/PilA
MEPIKNFSRDEPGAAALEYSLLLAFIAIVIIASVQLLGQSLIAVFTKATNLFP